MVRPFAGCGLWLDCRAARTFVIVHNHGGSQSAGPASGSGGEATEAGVGGGGGRGDAGAEGQELSLGRAGAAAGGVRPRPPGSGGECGVQGGVGLA